MLKKVFSIILSIIMVTGSILYVNGAQQMSIIMKLNDPNMTVNGVKQEVDPGRGTAPMIVDGRTVVPIRALIEAVGGTVEWDGGTQKITLSANGHRVDMTVGQTTIVVDGANKTIDVAPVVINDRTMVPVRFAAENLGFEVGWNGATNEITVTSGGGGGVPDIADINKLRSYILTLPVDEPTGGKVISISELNAILAPYYGKANYGSGNTFYYYNTNGDYVKNNGKWEMSQLVTAAEMWSLTETTYYKSLMETLTVFSEYDKEKEGVTDCMLMTEDDSFSYMYTWIKGAKEGELMKFPKQPRPVTEGVEDNYLPTGISKAMIYNDQTVDGQLCKVYSYVFDSDTSGSVHYNWLSTTAGRNIMSASYSDNGNEQTMNFIFDAKQINKDASFYNPPSDVNFVDMMSQFSDFDLGDYDY